MAPMHFHPLKAEGENVGYKVGANDVGAREAEAVGAKVGAAVGFDGQFVIPSLKTHKALASICCCWEG